MHILAAMTHMEAALAQAEAPARQLSRVRLWHYDIDAAAEAASEVTTKPQGMSIGLPRITTIGWADPEVRFVSGGERDRTHRAWLDMVDAICNALGVQATHGATLNHDFLKEAAKAEDPDVRQAARRYAALAARWASLAAAAANTGRSIARKEDLIMRPVGLAIAAVGGLTEVVRDKHYHQMGR